jgi:hypothetical protein
MCLRKILLILVLACGSLHPGVNAQKEPMELPEDFDYDLYMPSHTVDGELFHAAMDAANWIARLVENGTDEDIRNAERIIPGLLSCQDRDQDSRYYGAFRWERETPVEDLNAVEFVLIAIIPMMIEHEELLSDESSEKLRGSIRMALEHVRNIDVHYKYTNIVLKDIVNTILGGELLEDPVLAKRGYEKLENWMHFTDSSGGNYEYNSPYYTYVAIRVMSMLNRHVQDEEARVRSGILLARMSLATFLRVHTPTGRLAGPHGRAYHGQVIAGAREVGWMKRWLEGDMIPSWLGSLLEQPSWPDQVNETTGREEGISISTYKSDHYSFGVASRNMFNQDIVYIAWQSNVFTVHYTRPDESDPGIIYTRYVLDDDWLGDFSPGPGRPNTGLIPDVGHFQGVLDRNRAIGLYIPRYLGGMERHSSAKAVIALPEWDKGKDKIWIEGKAAGALPVYADHHSVIVIESGNIMMAFRPFSLTNLGGDTAEQIRVREFEGNLMIELYNYKGPEKTFWELAWPGTFFQGYPRCGFYAEVADRAEYTDGAAFTDVIKAGSFRDESDPPSTYAGTGSRKWRVEYSRQDRSLGMEVDLFDWFRTPEKWTEKGPVPSPMLDCRYARQDQSGNIHIGDTGIKWDGEGPAWLYRSPGGDKITAAYHGPGPSSFRMEGPGFKLTIPQLDYGLIVWENGEISIEAMGLEGIPGICGASIRNNE